MTTPSLADTDIGSILSENYQPNAIDFDKLLGLNTDKILGIDNTIKSPSLANHNPVDTGFFKQGNSYMDNAGQALGLAGGVMSLADMLNNWGVAKDVMKTNMSNIRQQMDQSKTAFDRSVARQDRSLAAVNAAEEQSKLIPQG